MVKIEVRYTQQSQRSCLPRLVSDILASEGYPMTLVRPFKPVQSISRKRLFTGTKCLLMGAL